MSLTAPAASVKGGDAGLPDEPGLDLDVWVGLGYIRPSRFPAS